MAKKPKEIRVGTKEYFDALIKHYSVRATWLVQCKGNLERDDLEYLIEVGSKLKDQRLKDCIVGLVGWGDDERAELETLLALGFEAMRLCSPSRLREAATRVGLKYYMKDIPNEPIKQEDPRLDGISAAEGDRSGGSQSQPVPATSMPGSVPESDNQDILNSRGATVNTPSRWHVIPVGDLREHESSPACWCKPTPDDEEHEIFVHHAMDNREAFETGERKPS